MMRPIITALVCISFLASDLARTDLAAVKYPNAKAWRPDLLKALIPETEASAAP